jgi:hypothetical protein
MRRDVFIANDSGGLSVIAADAADAIVQDARADDLRFVTEYKALLLELYGDDSMPVRVVVDEPLRADEAAQWLSRASWRIDTTDGRLLVMGGFDPDVLASWRDETGGCQDGRGVAFVEARPGSWRVDVYAHAGSMNGRQILRESNEKPGAAFRRSHPDRPFPLWLAKMLEFSGEEDPGYEELWRDLHASVESGRLAVDTDDVGTIGFLVNVTPWTGAAAEAPDGGWFARDVGRRVPATFPIGVTSNVIDPELASLRDRLLGRSELEPERPPASTLTEIIEVWAGDPLKPIEGGAVSLPLSDAFYLYWVAGLTADTPPPFELWVTSRASWTPPEATPDFAVVRKGGSITAIGPAPDAGGWQLWWTARTISAALGAVPDGATVDLAMSQKPDELEDTEDTNPAIGRALYSGPVSSGTWAVIEASPSVSRETLQDALGFVRDLVQHRRIRVRGAAEREAFDAAALIYAPEEGLVRWDGDTASISDDDDRTLLLLAGPVFRARHGGQWPSDEGD